jgi:multisubunit Na+/H+ antiporter MnhC subunit
MYVQIAKRVRGMETTISGSGSSEKVLLKKVLLTCGILAPLLYVGTDILAGALYPGYSFTSQAISELFAIGAPTSGLVVPLFTVSDVLLVTFALGVWVSAGRNRALHVIALMIVGNAVNGLVLWNFFPMHMRGVEATFTDTMHVTLAGTGVIFVLLALGFGVFAYQNWFRLYSVVTILALVVTGVVAFLYAPEVGANLSTPWLGLSERISTYVYDLWQVVLAIVLLRAANGLTGKH